MTWIGTGIATLGALLCLVAAIGLLRLHDALSRLAVTTKASTLGLLFSMIGVAVLFPEIDAVVKAAATLAFLMLVTPISGHLIGRAAYRAGLTGTLRVDELAEAEARAHHGGDGGTGTALRYGSEDDVTDDMED
ncbi:multicomponent Na+:H+ antiporter subunit G [Halopolyspora algeriensis]|uniref:Multicomponent Na+:H+ antiporter subunit G n=1 Tax=Halopolyspora algeriensis TaxID=1500506 RepID=A0A368VJG0_9ACTN|nr:monovalent cation/H(+) antiporter subunit G [Halopolyspora algeriensis]RCW39131.1 multicomponent Na+:H+ antiporter subunit G [Halopolyspora algeriensis]TQM56572.1 multicomponent Na+:H+ antiporter subunit G [Halopolyspora algeriensis]